MKRCYLALRSGFQSCIRIWKLIFLLWIVDFFISKIGLGSFLKELYSDVGNSMLSLAWLDGFNYTLMHDYLLNYKTSLSGVLNNIVIAMLIYIPWHILKWGGLVYSIKRRKRFEFVDFFRGGYKKFIGVMLAILIYIILQILFLWVCFTLLRKLSGGFSIDEIRNEMQVINAFKWVGLVYIFGAFLIWIWRIRFFVHYIQKKRSFLTAFKMSIRHFFMSFVSIVLVTITCITLVVLVFMFYEYIGSYFPKNLAQTKFIIRQIHLIFNSAIFIWYVSSLYYLIDFKKSEYSKVKKSN